MRLLRNILHKRSTDIDWEQVYREQYPRLYNFFRYRLGNDVQAEDLTAEVFERAWRNRHQYHDDLGRFEAWLFGIARNVVANHFRKAGKTLTEPSLHALEQTLATPDDAALEAHVQHIQDIQQLATLLDHLTDRERELIAFKYGSGLNNRQIAHLTGMSESNVGTSIHRTVQKLRRAWKDESNA
ncbi:MAG: sigma-70 family RNA polymerase sigma factor [Chloroflexota bacterium]